MTSNNQNTLHDENEKVEGEATKQKVARIHNPIMTKVRLTTDLLPYNGVQLFKDFSKPYMFTVLALPTQTSVKTTHIFW